MDKLTLKACIDTIERVVSEAENNWNLIWDLFQECEDDEHALEYASRHIIRFSDTTWGEHFPPYLIRKDGSDEDISRFFERLLEPRKLKPDTQNRLVEELGSILAVDG